MPDTLDVSCPTCGKSLKVPSEFIGKRVKCKGCQEVFPVKAPGAAKAAAAGKAGGKAAAKPAPEPPKPAPAPEAAKSPFLDDEDDATPMGVIKEDDVPRCAHCAKEMDPPDATVCLNCGFNSKTRVKAESKRVIAASGADWTSHLAPGIIAAILVFTLIGIDIYCAMNMREWMEGSILEMDEKDLTGKKKMYIMPGGISAMIIAVSLVALLPLARLAIRRLIFENKPEEKVVKK